MVSMHYIFTFHKALSLYLFIYLSFDLLIVVYWSCQYIARASNWSLSHWQKMGGVNIQDDVIIDKSIRRSLDSRASVVKVREMIIFSLWHVDSTFKLVLGTLKNVWLFNGSVMLLILASHGQYWLFVEALSHSFNPVVWLLLIRHFVAAMPWITVVLFNMLLISVTDYLLLLERLVWENHVSSVCLCVFTS